MQNLLKIIDAKILKESGLTIIVIILLFFIYDISTDKFAGVANAVTEFKNEDISAKKDLANALVQNAKALEGNTKIMEQVLRYK